MSSAICTGTLFDNVEISTLLDYNEKCGWYYTINNGHITNVIIDKEKKGK